MFHLEKRFYKDGIFVIDKYGEFVSLMFNNESQQEKCVKWLNNITNENKELNKEIIRLTNIIENYEKSTKEF